jgi:serine/threonine-protein kinase haspin
MQLQLPSDPASYLIETAASVSSVVSEIRIMNALTEVPGYVTFKGTYIVQGPPPQEIVAAYDEHLESHQFEDGSYFPHPETGFNENSTFLVLELGDAGNVLEGIEIDHLNKVWDLFLGVVMALSRAEITNEFEHRDLHENNICVRVIGACNLSSSPGDLRFGQSGLEVTLIDYGLSRARLESGEVIYNNLEADLALFHSEETGIAGIQFDTYRRYATFPTIHPPLSQKTDIPKHAHPHD